MGRSNDGRARLLVLPRDRVGGTNQNMGNAFKHKKKLFTVRVLKDWKRLAKRLWRLRFWKYSELKRTQSWATCSIADPGFSKGLGLVQL